MLRREENLKRFQRIINFSHPIKKQKLNQIFNEYSFHFRYKEETEKIIINLLKSYEHLKRKELANHLLISERQTQEHMTNLINKGIANRTIGCNSLGYSLK